MKLEEIKYFKISVDKEGIVKFDTNIDNSDLLIKVLAVANASTIDILNQELKRDNIADILIHETELALKEVLKGGEANESNE